MELFPMKSLEGRVLRDLEFLSHLISKLPQRLSHKVLTSREFFIEAKTIIDGVLRVWPDVENKMRGFYDRCGIRESDCAIKSTRDGDPRYESGVET